MTADRITEQRLTEQRNPRTVGIDRLSALEIVDLINEEDAGIASAVRAEREAIARAIDLAEAAIRAGGRIIYVGAGTSGRLGVLDASEMPPTFGTPARMVQGIIAGGEAALTNAVEGAEDFPEAGAQEIDAMQVSEADFVLGIATSGSTPFVHGALERAAERGARTGFLLCTTPDPDLHGRYDVVIAPLVGPEVITGSTRMKAGTATKMVLNSISTGAMIRIGKVFGNLMVDLRATNQKLHDRSERILVEVCDLDRERARQLLDRAGGRVKTAIAMCWTGEDAEGADRLLKAAGGRLGDLVSESPADAS